MRAQMPISTLRSRSHLGNSAHEMSPFRLLSRQLSLACRRQPVVLELAASVVGLPFRREPAFPLQPVQRGVKRAVLDLKHIIGAALDVSRDLMAVRPPQLKGPQDQHVECAAKKVDFIGLLRHGRYSTKIEDFLPLQSSNRPVGHRNAEGFTHGLGLPMRKRMATYRYLSMHCCFQLPQEDSRNK